MAKKRKVMITCAVTGAIHTPSMSPYLPITAEEIADAAVGAAVAVVEAVTAGVAAMTPTPAATPRRLAPAATERERQERFQELRVDRCICMVPMIGVAGESDVQRG